MKRTASRRLDFWTSSMRSSQRPWWMDQFGDEGEYFDWEVTHAPVTPCPHGSPVTLRPMTPHDPMPPWLPTST